MSIRDRLAAWWSAWQFVVYLAGLLALSVALNVWQWKRAITAPLRAEVADKTQALDTSEQLLSDAQKAAQDLARAARAASDQLDASRRDYAAAAKARPLNDPQCAPGQARVDATNRALGGALPEK